MKVVQRVRNYLDINFHEGTASPSGVIRVFITILTHEFIFFRSLTLERVLSTLVKGNRPSLLIESCSASPKLLGYQFS